MLSMVYMAGVSRLSAFALKSARGVASNASKTNAKNMGWYVAPYKASGMDVRSGNKCILTQGATPSLPVVPLLLW